METLPSARRAVSTEVQAEVTLLLPQIGSLLPPDIDVPQFQAALWLHLPSIRDLDKCTTESIRRCIVKAALTGMLPGRDVQFLPFRNKKTGRQEATFVEEYVGLIRVLERTGKLAKAFAHPVYEGDHFEIDYLADTFSHRPALGLKRTRILFYYGAIIMKDGTRHVEAMTLDQIDAIKRRAPAHEQGPWVTDEVMMSRKSCIKRVKKYVQLTPQQEQAFEEAEPAAPTDEEQRQISNELFGEPPAVLLEREEPLETLLEEAPPDDGLTVGEMKQEILALVRSKGKAVHFFYPACRRVFKADISEIHDAEMLSRVHDWVAAGMPEGPTPPVEGE